MKNAILARLDRGLLILMWVVSHAAPLAIAGWGIHSLLVALHLAAPLEGVRDEWDGHPWVPWVVGISLLGLSLISFVALRATVRKIDAQSRRQHPALRYTIVNLGGLLSIVVVVRTLILFMGPQTAVSGERLMGIAVACLALYGLKYVQAGWAREDARVALEAPEQRR